MRTFTYAAAVATAYVVVFGALAFNPESASAPTLDAPAYTNTMGGVFGIYRNDGITTKAVRGVIYNAPAYKFFEFPCPSTAQFEVRRPGGTRVYWVEDWRAGSINCELALDVAEDEPFSIWKYQPEQLVPPSGGTVRADTLPRVR